jgi:carbamoyltransferase
VVHVDDSCRIQTVSAKADAAFHSLLQCFKQRTHIPVLLNTSFNRKRMPIVETPAQALEFFLQCGLDALVIERFIVLKKSIPRNRLRNVDERLQELTSVLRRHQRPARAIGGICELRILGTRAWTIDLGPANPVVSPGKSERPDAVLEMTERDFWTLQGHSEETVARLLKEKRVNVDGSAAHAAILLRALLQR